MTKAVPAKQYNMPRADKDSPYHGVDSESVDVPLRSPNQNRTVSIPPSLWQAEGTLAVAGGLEKLNVCKCPCHPRNVHSGEVVNDTVDGSVDLLHTTSRRPPLHRRASTNKIVAAVGGRAGTNRSTQMAAFEPHPEDLLGDNR